ncbi:MAG: hypothetical protein IPN72_02155 [Saprospiraceae bacterium]|nr:hypothetical protein [Saprospiraceae bacterium]
MKKKSIQIKTSEYLLVITLLFTLTDIGYSQNVGIGTTNPQSKLHVVGNTLLEGKMTATDTVFSNGSLEVLGEVSSDSMELHSVNYNYKALKIGKTVIGGLDQTPQPTSAAANNNNDPAWQSFTAGYTAVLTNVELHFGILPDPLVLSIYNGEGLSGPPLTEVLWTPLTTGWVLSPSLNIPLTGNNIYTIAINKASGRWFKSVVNPYSGGRANSDVNHDFNFRTYMAAGNYQETANITIDGDISTVGNVSAASLQLTEGASINKVLLSDTQGNAHWGNLVNQNIAYWLLNSNNDIYNVNTGNVGIGTNTPNAKLHVNTNDNAPFAVSGTNSQVRIVESDNSNKQWKVEVQAGNFSVTENGVSVPLTIEAGAGDNALRITNNGITQVQKIKVGNDGSVFNNIQKGTFLIGPQVNPQPTLEVTRAFPTAFETIPRLNAICRNEAPYSNQFSVTIKSITTTDVTFIIRRLDNAGGWGQQLLLDWWAFQ